MGNLFNANCLLLTWRKRKIEYQERDAKDVEIPNIRWDVFELMMRLVSNPLHNFLSHMSNSAITFLNFNGLSVPLDSYTQDL